ncbi:glycopeptide [Vararia minispora EC-137]|uniref:Glycopeptide n=1 Tax=Vararia minispora EC-137 TaxID=1314806 RepID=A0ACB8Q6U8_9AGAM|nr:glycopeptide [Vararia minispora EC-137]
MFLSRAFVALAAAAAILVGVSAEQHTISFTNNCGFGTPTLKAGGQTLSTGGPYTRQGPIISAIAYLQTGSCGANGEGCTLVETTLTNPVNGPGSGSASDISLIPPHTFSVTSGFGYYNGCDGAGLDCTGPNCLCAFTDPTNGCIISCQTNNVNLAITFCD